MSANLFKKIETNLSDESLETKRNVLFSFDESHIKGEDKLGHKIKNNEKLNDNIAANLKIQTTYHLEEEAASLANSVYTELAKIIKIHGDDAVRDLIQVQINMLGNKNISIFFFQKLIVLRK